jgi:hypothetical protein
MRPDQITIFHSLEKLNLSAAEIEFPLEASFFDGFKMLYEKVEGKGLSFFQRKRSIFFEVK